MGQNQLDYSTLTVTSTAQVVRTAASPVMPAGTQGAVMTVEDDSIRYRLDGTAPTATEGHILYAGDVLTFDSWTKLAVNWQQALRLLQVIRVTSDAKLKISWFD